MRSGHTQEHATLSVQTALGAQALLLDAVQGVEQISRLFQFTLTMRASSNTLQASQVIGRSAAVTIEHPKDKKRYLNGILSRFTYLGSNADFALYSAEMVPSLWLLTLGRDRVIYQNKTAADIIRAVLDEHRIPYQDGLKGNYTSREYCVRYDESAFDFISRLMEEEGIFYFFKHSAQGHTLQLADSNTAFQTCEHAAQLSMLHGLASHQQATHVHQFELEARLTLKSQAVDDYNFLTPSTALMTQMDGESDQGVDYEYPGRHADLAAGKARARLRVEAFQAHQQTGQGHSDSPHLFAGGTFELKDHTREDLNSKKIVYEVRHQAEQGRYLNQFRTLDPTKPFRPPRVTSRPVVWGHHVAKVVGASGEEIWTDVHGRIKVQFPWDRTGKNNEQSSCWIRVSQIWAGQGWGALFLPRIGQEVVISYTDGDPDRPLITGSVYNAEQTPPIDLPAQSTQSTIRSRSSKSGSAGNEMRFEDKTGSEELYMHAQKDMRVEVENDLTTKVIAGNESHTVAQGNRVVAVEKGNETHTVEGTRTLEITGNETHTNKANFTQDVTGNHTLKVQGNLLIDVTGSITIKSAQSIQMKAGMSLQTEAGTTATHKATVSMAHESLQITSKASGMHNVEAGGILSLKGSLVKIN